MRELESEREQQLQYLRTEVTLLQKRNAELEDGLAERTEQLRAATERVSACEHVRKLQSDHGEDFMLELDRMIQSTAKLEQTRRNMERRQQRNDSTTAERAEAAEESQ